MSGIWRERSQKGRHSDFSKLQAKNTKQLKTNVKRGAMEAAPGLNQERQGAGTEWLVPPVSGPSWPTCKVQALQHPLQAPQWVGIPAGTGRQG